MSKEKQIIENLIQFSQKTYEESLGNVEFTNNKIINQGLCDIKNKPYLFVLACVMDRQIPAERAWSIPHILCEHFHILNFSQLTLLTKQDIINYFQEANLHRFNSDLGECFYEAVQRIKIIYNGDASKIWSNNPSSAAVVYRFLCFKGVGIKIATMAANILSRGFRINFSDMSAIDISPDTHVCRVLYRLGLIENEDRVAAIYKAKEINPSFPGLIDLACWKIGRNFCHSTNPECAKCQLNAGCAYYVNKSQNL